MGGRWEGSAVREDLCKRARHQNAALQPTHSPVEYTAGDRSAGHDSDQHSCSSEEVFSDSDSSSFETCSSASSYEAEMEILEAIKSDPDLLMKLIETCAEAGLEVGEVVERIRNLEIGKPTIPQKGLSDIDPALLKDYCHDKCSSADDLDCTDGADLSECSGSSLSDDEGEIELLYNDDPGTSLANGVIEECVAG